MQWIDISHFSAHKRGPETVARALIENGTIRFEGSQEVIAYLLSGIAATNEERLVLPSEGQPFFDLLSLRLRTPHLFAGPVQSGDSAPEPLLPRP